MGILEGDHVVTGIFGLEFRRDTDSVDVPLELDFFQEILTTLDALGKKYIASCRNRDNVGVFAEWLERNRIVDFSGWLPRIVELDEVVWRERLFGDWVRIVMLP